MGNGYPRLSEKYDETFGRLLERIASLPKLDVEGLTAFWPMCGRRCDGDLMLVGRAVNGWDDGWSQEQMLEPTRRTEYLAGLRTRSESGSRCPMLWVIDLAGPNDLYNTNRSAFWRMAKAVSLAGCSDPERMAAWPSYLCWSNLLKVAPSTGGNPQGALWEGQFPLGPELLAAEIEEFSPRRVLVLAGRGWFQPFADALGLKMDWREGYVEGIATEAGRRWVIAKHPMGKPEQPFAEEVLAALAGN